MIMKSDRPLEFIFYVQIVYHYHLWPYNGGLNKLQLISKLKKRGKENTANQ